MSRDYHRSIGTREARLRTRVRIKVALKKLQLTVQLRVIKATLRY